MFCRKCGTEILEGVKFCGKCGSAVSEVNSVPKGNSVSVDAPAKTQEAIKQTVSAVVTEVATEKPVVKNVNVNTNEKKEKKALKTFLSIVCSILIFLVTLSAIATVTIRGSVSERSVEKIISEIDVADLATDMVEASGYVIFDGELSKKDITKIYNKGNYKEYANETVNSYVDYIFNGDTPKGLNGDEIAELVEDNADVIFSVTGFELTDEDYYDIEELVDTEIKAQVDDVFDIPEIDMGVKVVRIVCSIYMIIALLVILVLFILLMVKVRKNNIDSLLWSGISMFVPAALIAVAGLLAPMFIDNYLAAFGAAASEMGVMIINNAVMVALINCGIIGAISAILIITYIIVKAIKTHKNRKLAAMNS